MKNEKETMTEPVEKKAAEKKTHRKSILGRIAKLLFLSIMILLSSVVFVAYFGGYLVNFFQPQAESPEPQKIVSPSPEICGLMKPTIHGRVHEEIWMDDKSW